MSGNLSEGPRKGTWRLRVGAGRDPVTGRYRNHSRTVEAATKTEAKRLLADFVREVQAGKGGGTGATVDQLLDRWLDLVEGRLSPTTLYTYRGYLARTVRPVLGDRRVGSVTPEDLDKLYLGLEEKGMASASIRQVHAIVRRAFGQAERWGWLGSNPARLASPPPVRNVEPSPPTAAVVASLLRQVAVDDPQLGRFLILAVLTGARRGELCGLRWQDVDVDGQCIRISRALIDVAGDVREKDTKTHAARTVALPAAGMAALREQRRFVDGRLAELEATGPARYVFVSPKLGPGSPWRPEQVTKAFRAQCSKLGVAMRLHDLRHFSATAAITAGVDVRTVAGRLGHADASTTLRVYSHFVSASDRAAADLLGETLNGGK